MNLGNIHCSFKYVDDLYELREQIEKGTLTGVSSDGINAVIHYDKRLERRMRTKFEFEPCDFSYAWQPVKAFCDGEDLYDVSEDKVLCPEVALKLWIHGRLYQRIEKPVTEREEIINAYIAMRNEFSMQHDVSDFCEFMADSGKFKLV